MRLLSQIAAQALDNELMATPGFSLDQLMELAGLSVACAVAAVFPHARSILTLVGPGNNGGDALVAARHLKHFGFEPLVVCPKPKFPNLLRQLEWLDVPITAQAPPASAWHAYDVVLDGVFGFSFNASEGIRAPFDSLLMMLRNTTRPVAAIDVPSGWDVERGDTGLGARSPDLLVSLTAPKACAALYRGRHFVGGRFLPPGLASKYGLDGVMERYPGASQCFELRTDECAL